MKTCLQVVDLGRQAGDSLNDVVKTAERFRNMKAFLRYAVSISLFVLGVVLLNWAAFRSWVSWGPLTEFSTAWAEGAQICLGYGAALVFISIGVFFGLGQHEKERNQRLWLLPVFTSKR